MSENISNKLEQIGSVIKPEVKVEQTVDKTPDNLVEQLPTIKKVEQEGAAKPEKQEAGSTSNSVSTTAVDDYHKRREQEIDAFLSDGLSETFLAMTPDKQKLFKTEGEETAKKINILLDAAKINVGKIVSLIKRWLRLITGINRFFLDQEAKIKADKIIKIKNKL